MEVGQCCFVYFGWDDPILKIRFEVVEKSGLQGVFFVTWTGWRGDNGVGGMMRLEGFGEKLGGQQSEMVSDRENLGLCMKVVDLTNLHASRRYSEGTVLNELKLVDG